MILTATDADFLKLNLIQVNGGRVTKLKDWPAQLVTLFRNHEPIALCESGYGVSPPGFRGKYPV